MKIKCSKNNLVNGVTIVSKAVPSKTTLSILQCILINAKDNKITFTANDMELGIETVVDGQILEEGSIALDAKVFSEIVRKLPDNEVTINCDVQLNTLISCEKAKFTLSAKDGREFTALPKIDKVNGILLSQLTLRDIIRQTIFCTADNGVNALMESECFSISGDVLKVAALDGHRIAYRKIQLKNEYPDSEVIIPGKTLNEISRILSGDSDKEVLMYIQSNHVVFDIDQTEVVSRLVNGQYFKFEQMLTYDYETKIKVNKKDLFESIDRSTLLVREGDKKPIIFEITDKNMNINLTTIVGSMDENIEIDKTGKDIEIGFNPKFFLDVLKILDKEEIDIYMVNPKAPCIIRDEEENYVYLILPVNFIKRKA